MNAAIKSNQNTNFVIHLKSQTTSSPRSEVYEQVLLNKVDHFKTVAFNMFENESRRQFQLIDDAALEFGQALSEISLAMHRWLGQDSILSDAEKNAIGATIRKELMPYLLLTNIASRSYLKPRGYAGDFLTISNMYDNRAKGHGYAATLMDNIFLHNMCSNAVKNRRNLLHNVITETISSNDGQATNITSFASGPAQELFDTSEKLHHEKVNANLIDIDIQALAHVEKKLNDSPQKINFNLYQNNLIHLALGRRKINLPGQDLVYSIGLIDYFDDKLVIKLINYAHALLKDGGQLVLGNFHTNNPMKAFMDHVLEWKLIHRSEEDMDRLFEASNFGKPCSEIRFEDEGINMFAFCTK